MNNSGHATSPHLATIHPVSSAAPLSKRRRARRRLFKLLSVVVCYMFVEAFCFLLYTKILSPAERGAISPIRNNTYHLINNLPHPYTLITLNPESRD